MENACKEISSSLAFVPTMGALHDGHIELVRKAAASYPHVAVSIFVNPTQFNNSEDLEKYPRNLAADFHLLRNSGATHLFVPSVSEVYPPNLPNIPLDISPLDQRFEGQFRPGHFVGVVQVLHRLFSIIAPRAVFFGIKDLQQCLVVDKLIHARFPQIEMLKVPTVREDSGLAKSSRNQRLSESGKIHAAAIYKQLTLISDLLHKSTPFQEAKMQAIEKLQSEGIETEYLHLVNLPNMDSAERKEPETMQALIYAGYLEGVRLIDNIGL